MRIQAIMVDFKYCNAVVIPCGRTGGSNNQTTKVFIGVKEQEWRNVAESVDCCSRLRCAYASSANLAL